MPEPLRLHADRLDATPAPNELERIERMVESAVRVTAKSVRDSVEPMKCWNCGTHVLKPIPADMVRAFHGYAQDFGPTQPNNPRLPFWEKGQCWMCQPLRAVLHALDGSRKS